MLSKLFLLAMIFGCTMILRFQILWDQYLPIRHPYEDLTTPPNESHFKPTRTSSSYAQINSVQFKFVFSMGQLTTLSHIYFGCGKWRRTRGCSALVSRRARLQPEALTSFSLRFKLALDSFAYDLYDAPVLRYHFGDAD
ncbi:hypothetical protein GGU11DRAFT_832696 [Lentinula aff. detonsa]|nr:hypothetical protein GGU11DRAFT_832696 [Lentinula aff. detonsa]